MNTFITNPTKKSLIFFISLYTISTVLFILVMSDLFKESILHKRYLIFYVFIFINTISTLKIIKNYNKNKNASI